MNKNCWKLYSDKKKKNLLFIIHNQTMDDAYHTKRNGIVTFSEEYNNSIVDYKDIKASHSWMCRDDKCPIGNQRNKEEIEYEKELYRTNPEYFKNCSDYFKQRVGIPIK